jgi:hypothetical protein
VAGYPAIAATGQAIVGLLSAAAPGSEFATATFTLASSADLQKAPTEQPVAFVFLYRVAVNTTRRNLPPRRDPDGTMRRPPVPVDLHYLLISSAKVAVTQHRLLGWCLRVIQDTPTLNAGFLNQFGPETAVFRPDETVELIWETLTRQEIADAWEIAKSNQQPSVSYVARIVEIESRVDLTEYPPVQTTDMRYAGVGAR